MEVQIVENKRILQIKVLLKVYRVRGKPFGESLNLFIYKMF